MPHSDGSSRGNVIARETDRYPEAQLLHSRACVKASASRPHRTSSRSATRARYELSRLPEPCRRLQNPEPYPVHFSRELEALLEGLRHGLTQPAGNKGA